MRATSRPNVVWVSFEDSSPFYPCYGDSTARMPHMDRLAREGVVYDRCFSTAGVCAPSRCAVITGMYAPSIGGHHMRTLNLPANPERIAPYEAVPPAWVKCFPEHLRAAGYFCTNDEKTDYQFQPPVSAWDECGPGAHWRHRGRRDQPFFAVFNPVMTHESGQWPETTTELSVDPAAVPVPPIFPDTPEVRKALARMYTHLEKADAVLGRILAELEEDGLLENTIVMHWSDHGPLPRGKRYLYDAGIRVPLVIRWPDGSGAGTRSGRMVSTVDLGPTVLGLCGVDAPIHLQGRAFAGPAEAAPRRTIFAARDRHDESHDRVRAARDERFKYIRNFFPDQGWLPWVPYQAKHPILRELRRLHRQGGLDGTQRLFLADRRPVEELYDTQVDPWETRNLAKDPAHAETLLRLRGETDAWMREIGDLGGVDEEAMVRAWYPDRVQPVTGIPVFIPDTDENPTLARIPSAETDVRLDAKGSIRLHCPTQGASLVYAWNDDPWKLYVAPLQAPSEKARLRAKAIRIGFKESPEASVEVLRA